MVYLFFWLGGWAGPYLYLLVLPVNEWLIVPSVLPGSPPGSYGVPVLLVGRMGWTLPVSLSTTWKRMIDLCPQYYLEAHRGLIVYLFSWLGGRPGPLPPGTRTTHLSGQPSSLLNQAGFLYYMLFWTCLSRVLTFPVVSSWHVLKFICALFYLWAVVPSLVPLPGACALSSKVHRMTTNLTGLNVLRFPWIPFQFPGSDRKLPCIWFQFFYFCHLVEFSADC